jgi:hypothetical protein
MAEWHTQCVATLRDSVVESRFWDKQLAPLRTSGELPFRLHLAIFVEPFLSFILQGRKTVESRFSVVKCAPYDRVSSGDVILLKRAAGPVVGLCRVTSAWFYELDTGSLREIRDRFAGAICADDNFWEARRACSYATLMTVSNPIEIPHFNVAKRDRRGWAIVNAYPSTSKLFA